MLACLAIFALCAVTSHAPDGKVVFIYKGIDEHRDVALIHPLMPVQFGVVLESGNRAIARGDVLRCYPKARNTKVSLDEGREAIATETVLHCDDRVLIVKIVDFNR